MTPRTAFAVLRREIDRLRFDDVQKIEWQALNDDERFGRFYLQPVLQWEVTAAKFCENNFNMYHGKRMAVFTNPTSVNQLYSNACLGQNTTPQWKMF